MNISPKPMKPLKWPTNKSEHEYMRMRQNQNIAKAIQNPNENWFAEKLKETNYKWTRQAQWGYRLFDFWCHELGIAVEIDGPEHDEKYDLYKDEYNYRRSGIVVLRVKNKNESDAQKALNYIASACTWSARKEKLGITGNTKKSRRRLVSGQQELFS